jgi:hypothetical protein
MVRGDPQGPDGQHRAAELSTWYSLDSVPKDGREVLFWLPDGDGDPFDEGDVRVGFYDAVLDCYFDVAGDPIGPICWRELPNGPASAADLSFERDEAS